MENYTERLRVLLFLEEVQMEIDIREFDLERVSLSHLPRFWNTHLFYFIVRFM